MRKGLKICPEFFSVHHMKKREGRKYVELQLKKWIRGMTEKMPDYR
jgi:hypothetical protein